MHCSACQNGNAPCLHNVPIFRHLDEQQVQRVRSLIRQRELERGAVLFREQEACDRLYIVRSGAIKLVRYSSDGDEHLIDTLLPGDFYGGDSLFATGHVQERAIALQQSGICMINGKDLMRLMQDDSSIALKIITYLNTKLEQYRSQLEMLSTKDAKQRLCMYLVQCVNRSMSTVLQLSQQDIGSATHLTKETVNRKLSELRDEEVVRIEGKKKLVVLDLETLKDFAFPL